MNLSSVVHSQISFCLLGSFLFHCSAYWENSPGISKQSYGGVWGLCSCQARDDATHC